MKKILIVAAALVLVACDNRPIDQREYSTRTLDGIPELKGCVYVKIDDIRIIRCHNSETSVNYSIPQGKTRKHVSTITIDENKDWK
jgi:hypothetical protein